ncbi:hypothetical protein [Streptomyces antarcticus]|uniref:hypothetical protein n=1 Tax=Streptomyces antarcticus TaxID=2996458 RepID=UPI00226E9BCC|nr:hypothetical protein [Streptomyces sp. H34-AA3]MCY0943483.1 hypothetical protein [Streptomyces sp. H34-AA3]
MEAAAENVVLVESLRAAVPLHMMQLGSRSPEELIRIAGESATVVGSEGDVLQFRSTKRAETAKAFNALARGLAAAALVAWGGATFAGLHWCTIRHCPGPDAEHPKPTHGETHA